MVGFLPVAASSAATVEVCASCEHTSLGAGVAAAGVGGTVIVHSGEYTESLTLTSDITIRSLAGSLATTWQGDGTNVVTISGGAEVALIGFRLRPNSGALAGNASDLLSADASRAVEVSGSDLVMEDVIVGPSNSSRSGAGVKATNSTVSISSSFFDNMRSVDAAVVASGSVVDLFHVSFYDLTGVDGNAVAVTDSDLTVSRCTFQRNGTQNAGLGGSIHADGGSLTVEDSQFTSGHANRGGDVWAAPAVQAVLRYNSHSLAAASLGGSVYLATGSAELVGGAWSGNTADAKGGAVMQTGTTTVDVSGAVFTDNEAREGGAWFVDGGGSDLATLDVQESLWQDNDAEKGGALGTSHTASIAVGRSIFQNNTAQKGGAIEMDVHGDFTIDASLFCRNAATQDGGAAMLDTQDDTGLLLGNVFVRNTSGDDGGAIWAKDSNVEFRRNTFVANAAGGDGDSLMSTDLGITVRHNIFYRPSNASTGGAEVFSSAVDTVIGERNIWWPDPDHAYGGSLNADGGGQNSNISGTDRQVDPLLDGYDATSACDEWVWQPAASSPARDVSPPIGATGHATDAWADADGDGIYSPWDCDDADPDIHPGAPERCNGVDDDCNGLRDDVDETSIGTVTVFYDADGDGFSAGQLAMVACGNVGRFVQATGDCNDADFRIYPEAFDPPGDGIDQDCGVQEGDSDGDGFRVDADCDDTDADINPDATEVWYDGVDQDCSGGSDYDQDGDGVDVDADCDDTVAGVNPGATEVWYDGVDQDCSGGSDYDQDGDGVDVDADCDDTVAGVNPGATEVWYDGVDQDCSGGSDFDQDGDGVDVDADCDDTDPARFPGNLDVPDDGIDQDCDDVDATVDPDTDTDSDSDAGTETDTDVDTDTDFDSDFDTEIDTDTDTDTGMDTDTDTEPFAEGDRDGDGYIDSAMGGLDCDDRDPSIHPGAEDVANSGVDANCDGFYTSSQIMGSGCGCSGVGAAPSMWGLFGLLLGAATLRRRR